MGEDRVTFPDKKTGDVLPSRQRHSSVISSCSEDMESETTSTGYPPTPDEEREEELEYGPGIVNKLRTRFLSITLKQNRGASMRRSCSMENLLDQDRPSRSNMLSQNTCNGNNKDPESQKDPWGLLKRAKSMDTLLMDLQPEPLPVTVQSETNGDVKKEPKIVRRRDGGLNRTGLTICDEELPKPDTVKTYKRMFEPAESRRGSYSRRPPVLRASAKSGSLSVSKINGVSSSAKVNGIVSKSKLCAKQSPPSKAQPISEVISNNNSSMNQPLVNGDDTKSLCNGSYVKATPIKIIDSSLCNRKIEKTVEKEINGVTVSKKDLHNNQKNDIICNGNSPLKELIKTETSESYVKPDVKKLVCQTYKVLDSSESKITNVVNGLKTKPKVPPNRPAFIKNVKPCSKITELNGIEKKTHVIPKLKPTSNAIHKAVQDAVKPEVNSKIEAAVVSEQKINRDACKETKSEPILNRDVCKETKSEPKLNRDVCKETENEPRLNKDVCKETKNKETKDKEAKPAIVTNGKKSIEENNRRNVEKVEPETKEVIHPEKTNLSLKKESEKEIINLANEEVTDTGKAPNNQKPETVDIKCEPKPVKKQQSSEPITTSMVFDFRGKDVVPHVAVLPVPFGCKALHPKKKSLLIDGKEAPNGDCVASDEEDEFHVDYSVPPPCGVIFEGENVKIGKGSILCTRNKDLKIKFDDNVDDNTFVYPSETSLLEDSSEQSLSPSPPPNEVTPPNDHASKLKANTVIGSSGAGGLSTYTPSVLRTMDNFEPGMFRPPPEKASEKEDDKNIQSGEEENTEVREDSQEEQMLKPADPGIISSWSLSAGTSDLLF